jgi:phenylacetate-CoA ligase
VNDSLLHLYHRLPSPARSLVASLRGFYLRTWRYGPETEQLVQEALERETWSSTQWKNWREDRLARVLHRAATKVPYYKQHWHDRRIHGDQSPWEYIENWSVLEKETLREHSRAFVAEDCNIQSMFHDHTSGTTGKSLDIWCSRKAVREWYALAEVRWRNWYGVSMDDRWGMLGGQLIAPVLQRQPPFWVWNMGLNQLYMSSYHLAPDLVPFYLDALREYRVKYILGYTSSLYALAQEILRLKRRDIPMTIVITNAEPMFDYQRQVIAEAFQCSVRETYGMAEIVAAASECQSGNLHLWPEAGVYEVLEEGGQAGIGDLVSTGLINTDMPLIRYRVGDRVILPTELSTCECGRTLPQVSSIEGRSDDTLFTRDGRRIGRLDTVFKERLPVREAQIIQETLDRIRVRVVPVNGYGPKDALDIIRRIQERVGNQVEVIVEPVESIPRTAAGKFRAVISHVKETNVKKLHASRA